METFTRVAREFSIAFSTIYGRGTAQLVLVNDEEGGTAGVDILVKDVSFALSDVTALLRLRYASQNLDSAAGCRCSRLSLMFPTTYDHL